MSTQRITYRVENPLWERIETAAEEAGRLLPGTYVRMQLLSNLDLEFERPPHPDPVAAQYIQREILLTPEELGRVDEAARRAGIRRGRWIRGALRALFARRTQ